MLVSGQKEGKVSWFGEGIQREWPLTLKRVTKFESSMLKKKIYVVIASVTCMCKKSGDVYEQVCIQEQSKTRTCL